VVDSGAEEGARDPILIGGQTGPVSSANRRHSYEAPERAQPGTPPPRDARALSGRYLAARNGRQNRGQHLAEIRDRAQRREVDAETLRRVDRSERRRQELRGEGPQQMRLAVDQIRQRLRAQRPRDKIGHPPLGVGDPRGP
jgi:hypothetical protein